MGGPMLLLSLSAPALVLTPSPRDLMPPPRALLLMVMLLTLMLPTDTTMASVKLRLTLLSSTLDMLDTLMLPRMELTPTLSLPPPLDLSTLPTLVSVLTTLELLSLAR